MRKNRIFILTKWFIFDAAHKLKTKTPCSRWHGHTWELEVKIKGPKRRDGMVYDFIELKKIINQTIIEIFDHHPLNDIVKQPTSENLIDWIIEELKRQLGGLYLPDPATGKKTEACIIGIGLKEGRNSHAFRWIDDEELK